MSTVETPIIGNPLLPTGFAPVITLTDKVSGKVTSISTVSIPAISATILTTKFQSFYIKNITACTTLNTIGYTIPQGQISFVLEANEDPPDFQVGPMDEIYIYMNDFELGTTDGQIIYGDLDRQYRVFTGLIDKVHSIFDPKLGKMYNIEFSTNMKKFNVTNEYKPIAGIDSNPTPALFIPQYQWLYPGAIIQIACRQSNVAYSYIYLSSGPEQTSQVSFVSNSLALGQDVVTDDNGIRTFQKGHPLSAIIPFQNNLADYQYQKWSTLVSQVSQQSFCEAFFSKFGQFYFRQLGMFRAKGDWDIQIDPAIVRSYDIFETDENIITRLELRWFNPTGGQQAQIPFQVWVPPNVDYLEGRYGPRYQEINVPWASIAASKAAGTLYTDPNQTQINAYLQDFATFALTVNNASAIQGVIQLLGNNAFEVGMTVYLPQERKLFYVTGVQHTWKIGDGWWTTLYVNYGRDVDVDFLSYIAVTAQLLGRPTSNFQSQNGIDQNSFFTSPTQIISSAPSSGAIDGSIPPFNVDVGIPGIPFENNPQVVITNGWGAPPNASPNDLNSSDHGHHTGVDIYPSLNGTCTTDLLHNVTAVANGKIIRSQWGNNNGWGNFVIQSIDGLTGVYAVYAHLNAITEPQADQGVTVVAGQILGQMGSTGNSSGPHLHFQLQSTSDYPDWDFSKTIDPAKCLNVSVLSGCPASYGSLSTFTQTTTPITTLGSGFTPNPTEWYCAPTPPNGVACPLNNRNPYLVDNSYIADVESWAAMVATQLCGASRENVAFFIALSKSEVGAQGDHFVKQYNFANINAIDSDLSKADFYSSIPLAATAFVNFMQGSNYTAFVTYMKNRLITLPTNLPAPTTSDFNANYAANLLKQAGYMTSNDAVNLITQLYNELIANA